MKIEIQKNIIIQNLETKSFLADAFYRDSFEKLPLVIFCHGYKGYKDWGAWNLMALEFAKAGFYFVKFNFSHNGTTLEKPNEFADLEAFGQNNFSKELSDLDVVIDYFIEKDEVDAEDVILIGHSRGGGICVLKSFEDVRVKTLVTFAGVSNFSKRMPYAENLEKWKKAGVIYTENARTKQKMPHYFQYFEDFKNNEKRFDIQFAAQHLKKPYLIIQGTDDAAVNENEAHLLHEWCKTSELFIIENVNHTFGAKEPWENIFMPQDLEKATDKIIQFLNNIP